MWFNIYMEIGKSLQDLQICYIISSRIKTNPVTDYFIGHALCNCTILVILGHVEMLFSQRFLRELILSRFSQAEETWMSYRVQRE